MFGYGVVGQGLHDVLEKSTGVRAEIRRICVKDKHKKRRLPLRYFTFDKRDILEDPEVNLVVELIDDADEAFRIVGEALSSGKNVVTANKKMVAEHLPELIRLQQDSHTSLLYEGAVCGAVPIIRNLEEYYDHEWLGSVRGIFNGSTNYILTRMYKDGLAYTDALQEAQEQGFAESDPWLDVSGMDATYKLSIIIEHAFGLNIRPEDIFHLGITGISNHDIRYAAEKKMKIKLVPYAGRVGKNSLTAFVLPRFITGEKQLYQVDNEYNGVIVEAAFAEKQFFFGKGAGGHPTGSAVLSDISANAYDYAYEYKKRRQTRNFTYTTDVNLNVYFRYLNPEDRALLEFTDISETCSGREYSYIIGKINLRELMEKSEQLNQKSVSVINLGDKPT